jgi:hypothetical protein
MTFGQVLDRIFGLLRRGFWPFVGIASVPAAGAFLLYAAMMAVMLANRNAFIQVPPFPDAFIRLIFEISLAATLPLAAIFAIYAAAASWAATQADLGVKAGFREAYGIALRRAGRYLGLMALIAAIAAAPMMLIEFGMFGSIVPLASGQGVPNFGLFALFPVGILLSMVWGILVGLRLALAFPASVVEDLPIWAAIKRSNQLAKGAKGRIFLVLLVLYAATYAAFLVFALALLLIAGLIMLVAVALHLHMVPWGFVLAGIAGIVFIGGIFLFYALTWSAYTTALAVLYHDQRRREAVMTLPAQPSGEPA